MCNAPPLLTTHSPARPPRRAPTPHGIPPSPPPTPHVLALTGDMEIDVKSFQNVLAVAILMALIGVALSLGSVEDATAAAAAKAGVKSKAGKAGQTPKKKGAK